VGLLKGWLANNPTLTIQCRVRQVHAFHRRAAHLTMAARGLHAEPRAGRLASTWASMRRRPVEAVTG
jgi:hypothetical protein